MTIRPDNRPSQALTAQLGFVRIGSHIDDVDGLEDILEYRVSNDDAADPEVAETPPVAAAPPVAEPGVVGAARVS